MIYNLAMYILELGVKLAALFSDKPAKMVKGYREVFDLLESMRHHWASLSKVAH